MKRTKQEWLNRWSKGLYQYSSTPTLHYSQRRVSEDEPWNYSAPIT